MQLHIITCTQKLTSKKWVNTGSHTYTFCMPKATLTHKKLDNIVTSLLPHITYNKLTKREFCATWHIT
jgi:hypothetical protein